MDHKVGRGRRSVGHTMGLHTGDCLDLECVVATEIELGIGHVRADVEKVGVSADTSDEDSITFSVHVSGVPASSVTCCRTLSQFGENGIEPELIAGGQLDLDGRERSLVG